MLYQSYLKKKPTDRWPLTGIFGPVEDIARGTWGSWSGERCGEGECQRFHCEKGKPCGFQGDWTIPLSTTKDSEKRKTWACNKNQAEKWKRFLWNTWCLGKLSQLHYQPQEVTGWWISTQFPQMPELLFELDVGDTTKKLLFPFGLFLLSIIFRRVRKIRIYTKNEWLSTHRHMRLLYGCFQK